MPIIEPLADRNAPLSQSDILKGVSLFVTHKPWGEDGGSGRKTEHPLGLVLSRPCVAAHKDRVIVAAIEKYKKPPPEFEDFDEAHEFFKEIRDGHTTLDLFYLGQMPGYEGSFCARLDSLHTIRIPTDLADMAAFLAACRIGILNSNFARDLHLRLFRAFASLGFDDSAWFSTEDLRTVVMVADRDTKRLEAELSDVQLKLQAGGAQSFTHETERKKLESKQAELPKKINALQIKTSPFREELNRR
ncbi:MAG: hypothetical protein ACYC3I_12990 [Gemmataceae bacterium]